MLVSNGMLEAAGGPSLSVLLLGLTTGEFAALSDGRVRMVGPGDGPPGLLPPDTALVLFGADTEAGLHRQLDRVMSGRSEVQNVKPCDTGGPAEVPDGATIGPPGTADAAILAVLGYDIGFFWPSADQSGPPSAVMFTLYVPGQPHPIGLRLKSARAVDELADQLAQAREKAFGPRMEVP